MSLKPREGLRLKQQMMEQGGTGPLAWRGSWSWTQIVREASGRPLCDLHVGQEDLEPPPSLLTAQESQQDAPGSGFSRASALAAGGDVGGS